MKTPQEKWDYVQQTLTAIENRVASLEVMWTTFEVTQLQHRRALCLMHQAMSDGLTEPPIKLADDLQKEWDRLTKQAMTEYMRRGMAAKRKPLPDFQNNKALPY